MQCLERKVRVKKLNDEKKKKKNKQNFISCFSKILFFFKLTNHSVEQSFSFLNAQLVTKFNFHSTSNKLIEY